MKLKLFLGKDKQIKEMIHSVIKTKREKET